jgi:hypothetical protein
MGWQDAPEVGAAAPAWASAPEVAVKPVTTLQKLKKGVLDPIEGGAQLLTKVLPEGVVQAGNDLNNWLADKTGLVGRLPIGGVDQQVREGEAAYQAQRDAAGESGIDGWRALGNVISPASLALGARLPAAATLAGRVGMGAASGAASGVFAPVGSGDFWQQKGIQAGAGAAFGGAVPAGMNALARLVSPRASVNPQIQALRAEGVRPTVGQTLGGMANRTEEKLTSIPLVGDAISSARRGAAEDLNRAAFNRALAPLNQQLPAGMMGREAVQHVDDVISAGYQRLLPRLSAQADQTFNAELGNLRQAVSTGAMDPNAARSFERILNNDVLSKFQGRQAMTGETLKRVESDLGQQISRLASSTDADQRLVGNALEEVRHQLRELLMRNNPQQANELRALNTAWANFKRVQRAASGLGAEDGIFTPAQLQSAVKALDRSKDKARFAEGNALMQDLSDAGKSVLGSKVPDSGTPGRIATGLLASGGLGYGVNPLAAALPLAGAGLYLRPTQNALTYLLATRPQSAQPIANALRQSSPMLVPLGTQVGLQALDR